jgi:hypothetical protein
MSIKDECSHTGKTEIVILSFPFGKVEYERCGKCHEMQAIKAQFETCPRCKKPFPIRRKKVNKTLMPFRNTTGEKGLHIYLDYIWACWTCATEILGKAIKEEFSK